MLNSSLKTVKRAETCRRFTTCFYITVLNHSVFVGIYVTIVKYLTCTGVWRWTSFYIERRLISNKKTCSSWMERYKNLSIMEKSLILWMRGFCLNCSWTATACNMRSYIKPFLLPNMGEVRALRNYPSVYKIFAFCADKRSLTFWTARKCFIL